MIGEGIAALIQDNTRCIFLESPGSITFEVQDIPAICEAARQAGVITLLDNTWASPLFFDAFGHGVDVSIGISRRDRDSPFFSHNSVTCSVQVINSSSRQFPTRINVPFIRSRVFSCVTLMFVSDIMVYTKRYISLGCRVNYG